MEDIAPPLLLISHIKRSIETGNSIKVGMHFYLKDTNDSKQDEFSKQVGAWLFDVERNKDPQLVLDSITSIHRRALLKLLERGLNKESIYNQLLTLEQETIQACQSEIEEKLTKLPYILMIPILFFQFPALLILILGPLIQNFIESLK